VEWGLKLKKAIRVLNQTFNELKLEKHPDKILVQQSGALIFPAILSDPADCQFP